MVRSPLTPQQRAVGRRLGAYLRECRGERKPADVAHAACISPETLRKIETGRLATPAFTTIVAAETVNGLPGIGGLAWSTKSFQQTDTAVMSVIVIGFTAIALDQLVKLLERRLVPWRGAV